MQINLDSDDFTEYLEPIDIHTIYSWLPYKGQMYRINWIHSLVIL